VLVATTHEDLADDLRPSVRVWKGLGTRVEIEDVQHQDTKSAKDHEDGVNHGEHGDSGEDVKRKTKNAKSYTGNLSKYP
jgi:hypothetical protein